MGQSISDKIDVLVDKVEQLSATFGAVCPDEVAAMKSAATDVEQADRAMDVAVSDQWAGGTAMGGGAVGSVACYFTVGLTGWGMVGCLTVSGLAFIGGMAGTGAGVTEAEAAAVDMEKAVDALDAATDRLCRCIMRHADG